MNSATVVETKSLTVITSAHLEKFLKWLEYTCILGSWPSQKVKQYQLPMTRMAMNDLLHVEAWVVLL